ncbi:unnamed protein product [Chilo suppressalis]|uniref:FAM194 C-terminal domain-containing protein n=1 Tax=Chilo suppressalis TaxID=168631 RepID=A0ABN8EBP5_CHISP|nr:unnamed protein product [Chilo suppressalis]
MLRCPCLNVKEEFQKIVDLKNTGVVVYRCISHLKYVRKKGVLQSSKVNNPTDVYILHNTNDKEILPADIVTAFDEKKISCPRCIHLFKTAKSMLKIMPKIGAKNIMGICNHCRKKLTSCYKCDQAVKQFVITRDKYKDSNKKSSQSYLSKVNSLLNKEGKQVREKKHTSSDIHILNLHHNSSTTSSKPKIAVVFESKTMRTKFLWASLGSKHSLYSISTTMIKKRKAATKSELFYSRSLQNVRYDSSWSRSNDGTNWDNYRSPKQYKHFKYGKLDVRNDFKSDEHIMVVQDAQFKQSIISDRNAKSTKSNLKGNELRKSMPVIKMRGFDDSSVLQLSVKYNSEDGSLNTISSNMDITLTNNFKYYFPKKFDDRHKEIHKFASSSELIRNTRNMLRDRAEKDRTKHEAGGMKQEGKEKKNIKGEEKKLKERERLKPEQEFTHAEDREEIFSAKQKQEKTIPADDEPSLTKLEKRIIQGGYKKSTDFKTEESKTKKDTTGNELTYESVKRDTAFASEDKKIFRKQKTEDVINKFEQKGYEEFDKQLKKTVKDKSKLVKYVTIQKYKDVNGMVNKEKETSDKTDKKNHSKISKYSKEDKGVVENQKAIKERKGKGHMSDTIISEIGVDDIYKYNKLICETTKQQKHSNDLGNLSSKGDSLIKKKRHRNNLKIDTNSGIAALDKDTNLHAFDSKAVSKEEQGPEKGFKATANDFKKLLAEQIKQKKAEQNRRKNEAEIETKANQSVDKRNTETKKSPRSNILKDLYNEHVPEQLKQMEAKEKRKNETVNNKIVSAPPSPTTKSKQVKPTQTDLSIAQIKMKKPSGDDLILKLVKLQQSSPPKSSLHKQLDEEKISKLIAQHISHKNDFEANCIICNQSDADLELESLLNEKVPSDQMKNFIIIGEKIYKYRVPVKQVIKEEQIIFFSVDENIEKIEPPAAVTAKATKATEQEPPKGIIRYALSDRSFIDKGWTLLPTEKVVRKMNVYRMRPAHPEFDWFEHNKSKRLMQYDTGEKLAEFNDNGRGRWFYKNGRVALDYYDAEETNAQQRFVIYSSGEPDERGRSRPFTILATFDYLGNGVVFDHAGKIRLKYNQTEGVVLDRAIGPASHWKWHTLNDPPVLQQVMIDTQMPYKDPTIQKLGKNDVNKPRPDNEDMLAIEFDNFIKEKSKKLTQTFKPFQIKMKALKINEQFSLKVLDQATIYLIFRDGTANLKLNLGMILDHKEIVDTDTAEVGEVSNSLERLPARTDSIAGLQSSVAHAQYIERLRLDRERRLRPSAPSVSVDQLMAAASRPMRLPLRTVPSDTSAGYSYKCRRTSNNLY